MAIYDINGLSLTDDIGIKDYFEDEMADTITKVRALQTEPNLTFFYITDIHAYLVADEETLYKTSVNNMRYLLAQVPCDAVVNLGDSVDGYATAAMAQNYGNLITNEFRKIGLPYFFAYGNHDDNRYRNNSNAERLTEKQTYQILISASKRVVSDTTGTNFYVDYPEFKIRMIFLNSASDYAYKYTTATCTWFSNVALNTPDDYGIIVNTHISPIAEWNWNENLPTNSATIKTAIQTYASSKDVLGVICGHNHLDNKYTSPFNGMTLCCNKFTNSNGDPSLWPSGAVLPQRTAETATEDLWTVVVVRPNSRKVNFIRFGAGSDYEFSY